MNESPKKQISYLATIALIFLYALKSYFYYPPIQSKQELILLKINQYELLSLRPLLQTFYRIQNKFFHQVKIRILDSQLQ